MYLDLKDMYNTCHKFVQTPCVHVLFERHPWRRDVNDGIAAYKVVGREVAIAGRCVGILDVTPLVISQHCLFLCHIVSYLPFDSHHFCINK